MDNQNMFLFVKMSLKQNILVEFSSNVQTLALHLLLPQAYGPLLPIFCNH